MGKNKHKFSFDSTDFISYIWSKRRTLITVSIVTAVIATIISLFITPKFRSSVILFPASSASISKTLLSQNVRAEDDLLKFGTEEEGEQLMQVLSSSEIRERIIKKFNLAKHYHIDSTSRYWKTKLYSNIKQNISFRRTEYMSIVIDVLDISPDTAAYIANEICNQIDSVMTHIQRARAQKALSIVEKEYQNMVDQVIQIQDSLSRLGDLGVVNYEQQSKAYAGAYAASLTKGRTEGSKLIENKLKTLAKYGSTSVGLNHLLKAEMKRLSELKGRYMEVKVDAEQIMPHKYIVDQAYKSEKKDSPKRSLIVLISTVSAFFMTLLLLIFRDSILSKRKG
jgi:uncharacterized protein involved in exopolysaccharide biosynthesis